MKSILIVSLFFILNLIGCNNTKRESDSIDRVNSINIFRNKINSINSLQLINNLRIIPLETSNKGMIGEISKIIKTDHKYFILDSKFAKNVFVFDLNGNFLYNVGNNGKGPGEYATPIDFSIDEDKNILVIVDRHNKLIKTDLEGNFIMERKFPENCRYIQEIECFKNYLYASTGRRSLSKKRYHVIKFDSNLNPIGWMIPYEKPLPFTYSYKNRFNIHNDKLFYISVFEHTIYQLRQNDFIPYYVFDFSGKAINIENMTIRSFPKNTTNAYLFQGSVAGKDLIYLPIFNEGRPYYGFFLREIKEYIQIERIINNDQKPFLQPIFHKDGIFISTVDSRLFNKKFPNSNLNINESNNPIVVEFEVLTDTLINKIESDQKR